MPINIEQKALNAKSSESLNSQINWHEIRPKLTLSNDAFLKQRITDGNLNEAIDIARIAWEEFPRLRQTTDNKKLIELVMESVQEKINGQVLTPLGSATTAMTIILDRLTALAESNPALIERGFNKTLEGIRAELCTLKTVMHEPNTRISELNQLLNQLVYKPIVKGNAGELVLTDLWIEHFTKDRVERLGGAGREDIIVHPYLGDGRSRYGEAISVERKTGKQKFTGLHREEAIRHAKENGAAVTMLIYDSTENLPQSIRPVSIFKEQGILVVVSDLQTGGWKMMREAIEIIMRFIDSSSKGIGEINVEAVQEVATDLGNLLKFVDQVRGSSAKIKSCAEEVDVNAANIKGLVRCYQERLQAAVRDIGGRDNARLQV